MPKFIAVLLMTIIIMLSSPAAVLSPGLPYPEPTQDAQDIVSGIVTDFELYTSILGDTYYDDPYLVLTCFDSPESAFKYLSAGFSPPLAQAIVDYYLQWVPQLGKLSVIPTDSIPVITADDQPYIKIKRISPTKVILERIYSDCYAKGDRYLYRITAFQEESRWIIVDLYFEPITSDTTKCE
jgi:hypothetical protein